MSADRALWKKTWRTLRNAGRILREQSRFKKVFVICFATICEAGLWMLFVDGFRFLDSFGAMGGLVVGRLFSLFFLGVGFMLAASGLLTSYATFFRSEEVGFLLPRPLTISRIVVYKFIEAVTLSSWAFFFVVMPFIGAYVWHERLSPVFLVWTMLFSIPFVSVCGGIGTVIMLLALRFLPRRTALRVVVGGVILAAAIGLWWVSREVRESSVNFQFALSRLIPGMMLASHPLMPSAWISDGIMSFAGGGDWKEGVALLGVLTSTALMLGACVEWMGDRWFFDCWQQTQVGVGAKPGRGRLLARAETLLGFVAKDTRAVLMKDLRTFVRDPMQWSQTLIFFGLLALYFSNLRPSHFDVLGDRWHSMLIFLNVFSVATVTCSLGARFVYPQLSLEGQGFWILGLAPTSMRRLVLAKFFSSAAGMVLTGVVLMLVSSRKLQVDWLASLVGAGLAAAVALAVCGLSTGLGAIFLDLKQRNPSAIVSGFGGTLNLVLSLSFVLAAILPFALIFHLHAGYRVEGVFFKESLAAGALWLGGITVLATALPLWLGIRSLRRRDF
jgi:ABC-2 type transport system permease protein